MMCAGFTAGIAAGLFGIGGGFVVVPTLLLIFSFFGLESSHNVHLAIGTSLGTIVFTSIRSVLSHAKRNAVDFHILRTWAPWIVLGVLLGLTFASTADGTALTLIFGVSLSVLSIAFLFPTLFGQIRVSDTMPKGLSRATIASTLGGFSALLGIGGGTVGVLTMTFCGRSIHEAVATAAGFGAIIAIPGVIGFAIIGQGTQNSLPWSIGYVNVFGVICIATVSFLSAPIGVAIAHRLPPNALKRFFGIYLLATSFFMLNDVFSEDKPYAYHPTTNASIEAKL